MTDTVLACRDLYKQFQQGDTRVEVLHGVQFDVRAGERVAIVGASGSGKTTLLQLLGGLDLPTKGTVSVTGKNINELSDAQRGELRNQTIGFVYQFHHLLPEFTALENAEMPLRIARRPAQEYRAHAMRLLERVGLVDRVEHVPGMLSGGEQQRVAIARALVMDPTLLLADEPTGDLDEHTADTLHDLLREMHRERGLTSVIATHNPRLAAACDRVLRLEDGRLRPA